VLARFRETESTILQGLVNLCRQIWSDYQSASPIDQAFIQFSYGLMAALNALQACVRLERETAEQATA